MMIFIAVVLEVVKDLGPFLALYSSFTIGSAQGTNHMWDQKSDQGSYHERQVFTHLYYFSCPVS